jgi:hypothetical protein
MRLSDVYQARFGVSAAECQELIRAAWREWEELHSTCAFAIAYGRKSRTAT